MKNNIIIDSPNIKKNGNVDNNNINKSNYKNLGESILPSECIIIPSPS